MKEAAEAGHPGAQHNLGVFLINGVGMPTNLVEGIEWFRKSASNGVVEAQFKLALLIGSRSSEDGREAALWLAKAAEKGHVEAMYQLAVYHLQGSTVSESVKWFRKAAENGHIKSQVNLGVLLFNGRGAETNRSEALAWYRKAADSGNAMARFNLGTALARGDGTEPDPVSAYFWLTLAAGQGDRDAAQSVKRLRDEMSAADLASAIRRVTAYETTLKKRSAPASGLPASPLGEPAIIGLER